MQLQNIKNKAPQQKAVVGQWGSAILTLLMAQSYLGLIVAVLMMVQKHLHHSVGCGLGMPVQMAGGHAHASLGHLSLCHSLLSLVNWWQGPFGGRLWVNLESWLGWEEQFRGGRWWISAACTNWDLIPPSQPRPSQSLLRFVPVKRSKETHWRIGSLWRDKYLAVHIFFIYLSWAGLSGQQCCMLWVCGLGLGSKSPLHQPSVFTDMP